MVESVSECVDEGLQLFLSMWQVVGRIEFVAPSGLGALDTAIEFWSLGRQHEEFDPAGLAFDLEDGFDSLPPSTWMAADDEGRLFDELVEEAPRGERRIFGCGLGRGPFTDRVIGGEMSIKLR